MGNEKYRIRRALLKACAAFECPQTLNVVALHPLVIAEDVEGVELEREWKALIEKKYLLPVPGYPDYWKLKPELREKIDERKSLMDDPVLAGPSALN